MWGRLPSKLFQVGSRATLLSAQGASFVTIACSYSSLTPVVLVPPTQYNVLAELSFPPLFHVARFQGHGSLWTGLVPMSR
jgi:hypothetical protein